MRKAKCLSIASLLLGGCLYVGPGWVSGVEGQVVDPVHGLPLEGAHVFVSQRIRPEPSRRRTVDTAWSATDANGQFSISGHFAVAPSFAACATAGEPLIAVYHADTVARATALRDGADENAPGVTLRFKVERFFGPNDIREPSAVIWACSFFARTKSGCRHLCELTVGVAECESARGREGDLLRDVL